jgi:hypothetical protein
MTIINDWCRSPTTGYYAVKLKVTFCVRGVITPILPMIDAARRQGIPRWLDYVGRTREAMAYVDFSLR